MALSAKQQRFVEEYLIDLNGTQAAIRAGYSENGATVQASRLLANANIGEEIAKRREELSRATGVTQERVIEELKRLAFSDLRQIIGPGGTLLPPDEWPDDIAPAIASMEIVKNSGSDDEAIDHTHKLKVWDKNSALEKLCKHLGLFQAEELKVTVTHEDRLDAAAEAIERKRAAKRQGLH